MKSQTEKQKTTETKKRRFKIEKLEERIAPHITSRGNYHYRGSGENHGNGNGHGVGGSGGHCGHGACK